MIRPKSFNKLKLVSSVVIGCVMASWAQAATNQLPGWKLVWSDEFDQADGSSPNPANWNFDLGASGWGNRELECYTSRTNNARIENGHLVIEAIKESYQGSPFTSARLKTQGKWSWKFGRIEARIKVPHGQGIWPAFWTLGENIKDTHWPACGEIDIMENIGKEPGKVHGTIHGPGYSGDAGIGGPYSLSSGAFSDDFHVFALEWTTNQLKWFVDDNQYFSVTPARLPGGTNWVFTAPHFLLLNVAVGGNWPGYPDESSKFPQRMLVDYVRVYNSNGLQAKSEPATASPESEKNGLAEAAATASDIPSRP
jgi:beta-glucanase (GH16 family)